MDYTPLFQAIISLIAVIISSFVIPWIKSKVDENRLQKFLEIVDIGVGAAEQIADNFGFDGAWKKAYVVDYLEKLNLHVDYDTLDNAIENAVLLLNAELKK